jgi:hypothetical protein
MNAMILPTSTVADMTAQAHCDSHRAVLALRGTADLRVSDELAEILQRVHAEALEKRLKEVDVNLYELEFMNSSCFKSFVSWVTMLQELPEERRYRVRFLSNPSVLWQRRSLHALSCFAPELISVVQGAA